VLRRIIGIICLLFRSKGLFCQIPKVLLTAWWCNIPFLPLC
jgi:hypothetical protein